MHIKSIKENLKTILAKQKELNYHFINIIREPASNVAILNVESELGLTFNDELRELYLVADGTNIDNVTPSGLTGIIPIHNFLNLEDAIKYYKLSITFDQAFYNSEYDFSPGKKLFPFLEDGAGNCYWVDLNSESENFGKIYWTNTFGEDPKYVFSTLTSMFQAIADGYESGTIWVDGEGYLDCDFTAFDEICKLYS